MERKTVARILELAPGVSAKNDDIDVEESHRLTLYIGEPGQAMSVTDVARVSLDDDFIRIETRDTATVFFFGYDSVQGLSSRPPTSTTAQGRRAGFS